MRRALAVGLLAVSLVALTGCHAFTFGTETDGEIRSHPVTITNTNEFDVFVRIDIDCPGGPPGGYDIRSTVGQASTSLCHRSDLGGVLRRYDGGLLVLPPGGSIDLVLFPSGVDAGWATGRAVPFTVWGMWCGFGCADIVEL